MIYDCNTYSRLLYINFIAILPFVCPKLACIELLISLHNDRHLFADGFVTVRLIAMKFGWDKESVSSLKFRKFHSNPSNFNRKLTMVFKLYFKKMTLTRFRTPVNRLILIMEMSVHKKTVFVFTWGPDSRKLQRRSKFVRLSNVLHFC